MQTKQGNSSKIAAVIGNEHAQISFSSENLDLIVDSDCIAWIVLNNKSKSVNIVNYSFISDFKKVRKTLLNFANFF